jgi:hypothetical protein
MVPTEILTFEQEKELQRTVYGMSVYIHATRYSGPEFRWTRNSNCMNFKKWYSNGGSNWIVTLPEGWYDVPNTYFFDRVACQRVSWNYSYVMGHVIAANVITMPVNRKIMPFTHMISFHASLMPLTRGVSPCSSRSASAAPATRGCSPRSARVKAGRTVTRTTAATLRAHGT